MEFENNILQIMIWPVKGYFEVSVMKWMIVPYFLKNNVNDNTCSLLFFILFYLFLILKTSQMCSQSRVFCLQILVQSVILSEKQGLQTISSK